MFKNEEMEINMGPQHPSTHGVLRLKLKLDGEIVTKCTPCIGYLHRGVEKICENKSFFQGQVWTDRMDYTSAIANNLGWAESIEKLFGITVPRRATYIRTMLNEFNRLASHLIWLATHGLDIGAMTVFIYTFREREAILDIFDAFCGSRLTTTAFRIGGLREDLPPGFEKLVRNFLAKFPDCINEYETLLTENRIWKKRTVGIGLLKAEDAIAMGVTGPVLRAAGVSYDIRKAFPYAAYSEMDFEVPTRTEADTYARYLVRLEEMRQSTRIIQQCIDGLPEGPVMAKLPKVLRSEVNEVYHPTEAPKGELGYYLVGEKGSLNPYRFHVRAPGFINLQALPMMIEGGLVADVIATIGTLDVVLGEIDR
ncbi:NADH-quinone oxidoreductase subunit D [Mesoterricola silvestris]|uniref:NADH-quinone oxidoreductase subunit D n=1 Tax=Mesoterricola silvestris TaxID=2927979 RepID=A0AA48KAG4_9BACT|nr:NADH-quinone oxidoreductase subunit D [Mesoterricola silvestris]BDU75019.1 NADH-quinone oxidoreductase subunit D [Mesoterricola silvestris]